MNGSTEALFPRYSEDHRSSTAYKIYPFVVPVPHRPRRQAQLKGKRSPWPNMQEAVANVFPRSSGRNHRTCTKMWNLVLATSPKTVSCIVNLHVGDEREGAVCVGHRAMHLLSKVLLSCSRAFQTALALSIRARLTPGSLRRNNKCTPSSSSD